MDVVKIVVKRRARVLRLIASGRHVQHDRARHDRAQDLVDQSEKTLFGKALAIGFNGYTCAFDEDQVIFIDGIIIQGELDYVFKI